MLQCILRERFWICKFRRTIRSVVNKCTKCRRNKAEPMLGEPTPLSADRVENSTVFEVIGIDFAGPLFLKNGETEWVALFTCVVYRALHLELVASLSTDSFLLALRRFISRRVWKFNPPTASWWGGWWDRLVRVIKELLRRTLGKSVLSYEELMTILCDCESIINSRPLTDLRSRFRREYLSQLIQRHKHKDKREPRVGEIVLVGNVSKKRINWPLAVIVELVSGRDGNVRTVKVKTQTGLFLRPIQRIFPLEIDSNGYHSLDMKGRVDDGIHDLNAESRSPEKRYVSDNEIIRENVSSFGRRIKTVKKLDLLN
ncbi:integrase catalytic domain-containing protein [Trichonephila clavipes]|nr:integrase catalytic domain-containing protein [Trichonephila clavipes]